MHCIEYIAYTGTILILTGYACNSYNKRLAAAMVWIAGDMAWIIYDLYINNLPHVVLSLLIVALNVRLIVQLVADGKGK